MKIFRFSRALAAIALLTLVTASYSSFVTPAAALVDHFVTYDLNGAPGQNPDTEILHAGDVYYVPQNPVWEDHFFLGWSDDYYDTTWGGPVQMNDSFEMPDHDVVMAAQWDSTVHPIVRSVYNNNSDATQLWAWVGNSPHSGADINLGWCVTSGPNADPKTWIVLNHTSDVESESLYIASPNQFTSGVWYEFSPDPSLSVSQGETQVVSLGDPISDIVFENSGCEATSYEFTPNLPAGLEFNFETMTISGTPLEALETTTFELSTERWYTSDEEVGPVLIGWSSTSFDLEVQSQASLTKKISKFKTNKSTLTNALKIQISEWALELPESSSITCQGAVGKKELTNKMKQVARKRALVVCRYAKHIRSDLDYIAKRQLIISKISNPNFVLMKIE